MNEQKVDEAIRRETTRIKECLEEADRLMKRDRITSELVEAVASQFNQANNAAQRLAAVINLIGV